MNRRKALQLSAALPFAATSCATAKSTASNQGAAAGAGEVGTGPSATPFNLAFAPHAGTFKATAGTDVLDQIRYAADQGFTAWEDNGMPGRTPALQQQMGELLEQKGMRMGVFVANTIDWQSPTLTLGAGEHRDKFLVDIRNSVEVAKRCNATWATVVPGVLDHRQEPMYQFANVMESLKQAAGILEPHGIVMVLEPLNYRDHPSLMLTKAAQAYALCKAVDSPSCKILFDIYHQQIHEGNLIPNIDASWDEIAYFQIGDNPGRKEPTTGEINYRNVLAHIHSKGFTGIYGMEHGNSMDGKEGEARVIQAYREVDVLG
ncbi:hydroxypyruvate isomerase family protein [Lewinella sp. 4G2]|uniref:hydroxypyruvate isomerase family protein n=1 Tax=Lewinella sp. 4G2 TaxID=1803372 RepID=UPI0007B4CB58|nr:TIM barrel protein [Lewinella sp. 4G2]OAV46146.1 xylose isomerase [Lewinella sp. 4G2]